MSTIPPVSSTRYIPKPDETTLRNKVCQGVTAVIALGGVALAASAFRGTGRPLVLRAFFGGIGAMVSGYIFKLIYDIDGRHSGRPRLMEGLSDPLRADWLLFFGANPNACNRQGYTPLHFAINLESIRSLIAFGADVNARSGRFKETPLYMAVEEKNLAKVGILLDYKADVTIEYISTQKQQNPLDLAKELRQTAQSLETLSPIDAANVKIFDEIIQVLEDRMAQKNK